MCVAGMGPQIKSGDSHDGDWIAPSFSNSPARTLRRPYPMLDETADPADAAMKIENFHIVAMKRLAGQRPHGDAFRFHSAKSLPVTGVWNAA